MTQLLQPTPASLPTITPQMVFAAVDGAQVSCYWCRKLVKACNGEHTLGQIAESLHLPLQVCIRLTKRAYEQGWIKAQESCLTSNNLWDVLLDTLGEGGEKLLDQAAQMSRCEPGTVPCRQVGNFLIAVELLLPDQRRGTFAPFLDILRLQHAC